MSGETGEYRNFDVERQQIAQDLADLKDKSPKGSIDEPVRRFLDLINTHPDWISTSTCSGRLVSYLPGRATENAESQELSSYVPLQAASSSRVRQAVNGKGGGNWLFVSHSTLEASQLENPIETLFGDRYQLDRSPDLDHWTCGGSSPVVHLVYQPPVFHLLARSVAVAVPILTAAIGAGFRNSGITVGHRGRVILAIRASTGGLDVPIAIKKSVVQVSSPPDEGSERNQRLQLLVPVDYLAKLLVEGNRLMEQNELKLQRLFEALSNSFDPSSQSKAIKDWESAEDRRRRMREEGLAARAASLASRPNGDVQSDSTDEDMPPIFLLG